LARDLALYRSPYASQLARLQLLTAPGSSLRLSSSGHAASDTMAATGRVGAIERHLVGDGIRSDPLPAAAAAAVAAELRVFGGGRSGVPIAYRDVGPASAPAVLFVPGVGGRGDVFDRHLAELSDTHRCIALDNRGVGGSGKPTAPYSIDDMALDALDLLAELLGDDGAATIVGQSMGGMIAQRMAVLEPQRVRALVLCSTVSWCDGRTAAYWGSLPLLAEALAPPDFTKALLPWLFGKTTLEDETNPLLLATLAGNSTAVPTPSHTWALQIAAMLAFDSRCEKRLFLEPFSTQNDQFAKTGSGQS
jgi:pimeloyl-ACP methyl ester carboxylesterase